MVQLYKQQKTQLRGFLEANEFWTKNKQLFPESSAGGELFAIVARVKAQIDALNTERFTADAKGRHVAAARATVRRWMRDVARTSRAVARRHATIDPRLLVPRKVNDQVLLDVARSFLDRGVGESEALVRFGLAADWQTAFKNAIDAFETSLTSRISGRSDVSGATRNIKALLAEGADALRTLDVVVANTLKDDPVLLDGWLRCRRGTSRKGSAGTSETTPEASSSTPTPTVLVDPTDEALKKAS